MGRYVLTPDIFDKIKETGFGVGGEIQLTDALAKLDEESKNDLINYMKEIIALN